MRCPRLADLPPPPPGLTGWPWTTEALQLPDTRPDGSAWPRITIVTPSFNQGQFIEETIRSILLQGYPDLEYLILDGGSTDASVAVIEKYTPWLSYWHSQPDKGQSDAINGALAKASGHWFQNINSDDILLDGALGAIGSCDTAADLCTGDVIEFLGTDEHLVRNTPMTAAQLIRMQWRSDTLSWHQPGIFFRRDLLTELGGYPAQFHYVFDLYLTVRYLERVTKRADTGKPLVRFRIHPTSKSSSWQDTYIKEGITARELLASTLTAPSNRAVARVEAARRRMFALLGTTGGARPAAGDMHLAVRLIAQHPSLAFDRMALGSVRRNPIPWLSAIFSAG